MSHLNTSATFGDLTPILIWVGALGKAPVASGALTKQDIIVQLNSFSRVTKELNAEVKNMIATVQKW